MSKEENPSMNVSFLYPCPILKHVLSDVEALNTDLRKILLAREQSMPELNTGGISRSNVAGWKSRDDLLRWPEPAIKELQHRVVDALQVLMKASPKKNSSIIKGMELYAWANINRTGSYNTMHNHPGNHWAAVYYVDAGKPDPQRPQSGLFEIQDPRTGAMNVPGFDFGDKVLVNPVAGLLMLFPAWMNHCVHPFFGEGERISIAFNVRLDAAEDIASDGR